MKILIPVDGSANADHAVDYVITHASELKEAPEIFLLNVQWKLALGNVKLFIDQETVKDYYREQGLDALSQAREKLYSAKITYSYHISVGSPADTIVRYSEEQKIDQIVMSAPGQESITSFLLGSVASKVVQLATIPVLIVK